MSTTELSIIIPHYERPDLLYILLTTIPKRSEIEVIVIDDHSSDNLSALKLAEKYPYVFFIKNKDGHKGAGAARNTGLEHARGKWILFADADDYFTDNFYDTVKEYFNTQYDIIFFPPLSIYNETGLPAKRHIKYYELIKAYADNKSIKNELLLRYRYESPCSKLINKNVVFVNNINFDETHVSNDVCFSMLTGYFSKKILCSNNTIYMITDSSQTLTKNKSTNNFLIRLNVFVKYFLFLKNNLIKKDFKLLELSGTIYLTRSIRYGIRVFFETIKTLIANQIPLIKPSTRNIRIFIQKFILKIR